MTQAAKNPSELSPLHRGVSTIARLGRVAQLRDVLSLYRWTGAALTLALLLSLPLAAIAAIALQGDGGAWRHLFATVLPNAFANTLFLITGAGVLASAIGAGTAWLITMYRFPGRNLADRLLVLPLAIPLYIAAYAYADLLDYAGPVQSAIRSAFGFTQASDYYFPNVRSPGGAIFMFAFVLYPYVYLLARASFEQQSVCALEVARTLGATAGETFWRVALPLARPSIAAGGALVIMECLNDLGAVQYLGVDTLSASIFATWQQRGNLPGAAQIAFVMLLLVASVLVLEKRARGEASTHATTGRYRAIPFETLQGRRAFVALLLVLVPVLLGFALPVSVLVARAWLHVGATGIPAFATATVNSLILASLASGVALLCAVVFAYAMRLEPNRFSRFSARAAGLGYALPGTVLAIGVLSPLAAFDNTLDAGLRANFGVSSGLLLSGSLFAVTVALVIRFLSVALGAVDAGLQKISPNLDAASRTLGASSWSALLRVHFPMLAPALGAAALLVFVDAMKELPATLLLRPFNFQTLATHVYALTATEQFEEAALGAIAIVGIGLIPVLALHKTIAGGRAGGP